MPRTRRCPADGPGIAQVLLTGENTPQGITVVPTPCVLACSPSCCSCPRLLADTMLELVAELVVRS